MGMIMGGVDEAFVYPNPSHSSEKISEEWKGRTRFDYGDDQGGKVEPRRQHAGTYFDAEAAS